MAPTAESSCRLQSTQRLTRANVRLARLRARLSLQQLAMLRALTKSYGFSLAIGDLRLLDDSWYVTHSGLLRLARAQRCRGIDVNRLPKLCDPSALRWAFKARVYTSPSCKGFVGFADADPSTVPAQLRGCEMRIAETRAVNRALRKAYGIGLCSVEELGPKPTSAPAPLAQAHSSNGNSHQPLVRDRLCRLIRTYRLDAESVKRYAADFCGTSALRDASKEMVEDFVKHLEQRAAHERDALVSHLQTFARIERKQPHETAEAQGS